MSNKQVEATFTFDGKWYQIFDDPSRWVGQKIILDKTGQILTVINVKRNRFERAPASLSVAETEETSVDPYTLNEQERLAGVARQMNAVIAYPMILTISS